MFGLNQLRPALRTAANSTTLLRSFSASARRDFARLTVVGRLGAAPELTTSNAGREYVRYVVATNSGPRENPQTSWFRVASFQPDGPARQYLLKMPKGTLVCVEGDASVRMVENSSGSKSSQLNIAQRSIHVLQRGREASEQSESESGESH